MDPRMIFLVWGFIDCGRFCSSCMANGVNSSAYLVMGVRIVAQSAIFVTTKFWGMLRVICGFTWWPNSLAPMNANAVYKAVTVKKLTIVTCRSEIIGSVLLHYNEGSKVWIYVSTFVGYAIMPTACIMKKTSWLNCWRINVKCIFQCLMVKLLVLNHYYINVDQQNLIVFPKRANKDVL